MAEAGEYSNIAAALARIEAKQDEASRNHDALIRRLYGNGQPGDIQNIVTRQSEFSGRIDSLETWRDQWIGRQSVISAGIAATAAILFSWLKSFWAKS